jgi:hypothetical protein
MHIISLAILSLNLHNSFMRYTSQVFVNNCHNNNDITQIAAKILQLFVSSISIYYFLIISLQVYWGRFDSNFRSRSDAFCGPG